MFVSKMPDGGADIVLTYKRHTVWPQLASGYYGDYVIHGDVIMFEVDWPPGDLSLPPESAILAAVGGSPAVDITPAVLRVAQRDAHDSNLVSPRNFEIKTADAGVRVQFRCWIESRKDFEIHHVSLTWQDVSDLVARLRLTGTQHEFRKIRYYAEQ